jgi:hypothetical protein
MTNILLFSYKNKLKSGRRGSNPRHPAWEADTLPAELRPPIVISKINNFKIADNHFVYS